MEIDSSPIKRTYENAETRAVAPFLSSPVKKKKSVAFSGTLVSDLGSSPVLAKQGLYEDCTPRKSILKPNMCNSHSSPSDPNNASLWAKSANNLTSSTNTPKNPLFWLPGTIIQLLPNSADLPQLIEGCIHVLGDSSFDKKFEVYATLNHICKTNTVEALVKLLTIQSKPALSSPIKPRDRPLSPSVDCHNYVNELSLFVQRDITSVENNIFAPTEDKENDAVSPGKVNPFTTRTLSQALKLMCFLMITPELNTFLSVADVKWYYTHSCEMIITPTISKTLLLPYLSMLKDCKFVNKKKRLIFESGESSILEQVLFSLLKMKKFPSSSLVAEKYITLRNLVLNFPLMMARNFNLWFGLLVANLCDLTSPLYTKVVSTEISCLLEVARNYLDNDSILYSARKFLESPLALAYESLSSDHCIGTNGLHSDGEETVIEFVIENLETLIHSSQQKQAMDIWVGLTLLVGGNETGFDSWKFLSKWLQVHKLCFNQSDPSVKVIALTSWKAVIHNMCYKDLKNLRKLLDPLLPNSPMKEMAKSQTLVKVTEILRPKVKLLIYVLVNMTSIENQKDIIDTLHGLFLSMVYTLVNPLSIKNNFKYMHIYWDKIIQPVLTNFYFKKDISSNYMNELGLEILTRLLKNASPINDKNFNDIRCLSSETVTLNEINSLSPKWIVKWFDRIMQNLVLVFKMDSLSAESKFASFNTFLNSVKVITRKEMKTSDSTFDLIDNIPFVLKVLLKYGKPSFDLIFKLVINLNDTFGACHLINHEAEENAHSTVNVYSLILDHYLPQLNTSQANDILNLMYQAIGEKKNIILTLQVVQINAQLKRADLDEVIGAMLSNKRINRASMFELSVAGQIFQLVELNYGIAAKKLIQDMVLVKPDEFERLVAVLKVQKWTLPIFKFFISLIHDAPLSHLKQMGLNLILSKWEDSDIFLDLFTFLVDLKFDLEIFNLRKNLMKKAKDLDDVHFSQFTDIWTGYVRHISVGGNFVLLDQLLVCSFEAKFEIKSLINNCWEKLPLLKKAWLEVHEELYCDPELLMAIEVPEPSILEMENVPKDAENMSELIVLNENASHDQVFIDLDCLESADVKERSPSCQNQESETDQKVTISTEKDSQDKADLGLAVPDISRIRRRTRSEDARLRHSSVEPEEVAASPRAKGGKKLRSSPGTKGKKKARKAKETSVKKSLADDSPNRSFQNGFDIHSFTALLTAKLSTPPKEPLKAKKRARRVSKLQAVLKTTLAENADGVKLELKEDLVDSTDGETPQDSTNDTSVDESTANIEKLSSESVIAPTVVEECPEQTLVNSPSLSMRGEPAERAEEIDALSEAETSSPAPHAIISLKAASEKAENEPSHRGHFTRSKTPIRERQLDERSPKRQKLNPQEAFLDVEVETRDMTGPDLNPSKTMKAIEDDGLKVKSEMLEEARTLGAKTDEMAKNETTQAQENNIETKGIEKVVSGPQEVMPASFETQLVSVQSVNALQELTPLGGLADFFEGISNEQIAAASKEQRYNLETQLMEFMMRMRRVSQSLP